MLRHGQLPAALALALALAPACGGTGDLGPFAIRLAFDTDIGGCSSADCDSFGMSCGAKLSVRIVDANSGALLGRACETISASETACDLGDLPPGSNVFFDLPPSMLRIEVAAWSQSTLDDDPELAGDCPDRDIFDLRGVPLATFTPQPAFAGAAFFDAGSDDTEAVIPLACTDPVQLDAVECAPPFTRLSTTVLDLERLRAADQDADDLLVRAAFPRTRVVDEMTQETETIIETATAFVFGRENLGTAEFTTVISDSVSGNLCTLVLQQTPQATTTAICQPVGSNPTAVDLDSAFLSKPIADEMLAAIGLSEFPEEGLLVGRVFDQTTGTSVSGITMLPAGQSPTQVQYLNSSRTGTIGDRTLDNGYFIATDIPFDTSWSVSGTSMVPAKPLRGGLIRGHLTIMDVPLSPPL